MRDQLLTLRSKVKSEIVKHRYYIRMLGRNGIVEKLVNMPSHKCRLESRCTFVFYQMHPLPGHFNLEIQV